MTRLFLIIALCFPLAMLAVPAVKKGVFDLPEEDFQPGQRFDLTGEWRYKPGYLIEKTDHPETDFHGFESVPVPQFLNRVRWWLDDSEDFIKYEDQRLEKLGFDTDKAVDGWYELQVNLPTNPKQRHVSLQFDGVAMIARVYCNGRFLGEHKGMFSRFEYDLTPALQGGENHIAVYVSMEKNTTTDKDMGEAVTVNLTASKVLSMSKGMFGPMSPGFANRDYDLHGIWQPVKLIVRSGGKIDDVWFVPSLTGGEVRVEATRDEPANLRARWMDLATGEVFHEIGPIPLTNKTATVSKTLVMSKVKPRLWTPADPNLYHLEVRLEGLKGELIDSWNQKVGFRTFEVRSNKFLLNGKPYWLRGADHLPYGKNPWDPELPRILIKALHDANLRVTRTHATPWNEAWLDAADEIGLGVSIEGIRPWGLAGKIGSTPPAMMAHWLMENEDVIKRVRNHPSVFIYTIGNEMMLRDPQNVEKWQQLSQVVKQTRRLDPTRPVIASSEYQRDPDFYKNTLQPMRIDDGDADDLHRYYTWYKESCFVDDATFKTEMKWNAGKRPLIGQEMSTGYPDLDTGLPVLRYTRDLLTPQAWIGTEAYPGSDPAVFLEHQRAVTKRWAEELRYSRGENTAGFMMFAAECWFAHSYDPRRVTPYPVYSAMRDAFAPIGLAWATNKRRFYSGDSFNSSVYITNDDDGFRNFKRGQLQIIFNDGRGHKFTNAITVTVTNLDYYKTTRVPVRVAVPEIKSVRQKYKITFRLSDADHEVSETTDNIEIFRKPPIHPTESAVTDLGLEPDLAQLTKAVFKKTQNKLPEKPEGAVILIGPKISLKDLQPDQPIYRTISHGATAVLFLPSTRIAQLFPDDLAQTDVIKAEFGDFSAIKSTPLAAGLESMDLKWWGRKNDNHVYIASHAHRLMPASRGRVLVRYIPPHGYIAENKLSEQYWSVLTEISVGYGRIWICDLDLEKSIHSDPAARIFAENLLRAAAEPGSTRAYSAIPAHDELLKGKR